MTVQTLMLMCCSWKSVYSLFIWRKMFYNVTNFMAELHAAFKQYWMSLYISITVSYHILMANE